MYVTNLTNRPVGVDGIITLRPNEENRYIKDTGDLYIKVSKLVTANLVSVSKQPGLTKTFTAEAVSVINSVETSSVDAIVAPEAEAIVEPSATVEVVESTVETAEPTKSVTKKRGAKRNVSAAKPDEAE